MPNIRIEIDRSVADQLLRKLPQAAATFLRRMSEDMTQEMKDSFDTGGKYRLWPSKKGDGSLHWSAPPGKPPNSDTHALKVSLRNMKVTNFSYRIEDGVPHGKWQELGTSSGGWGGRGHAPRPFVRPVFKKYGKDAGLWRRYAREAGLMKP